MPILKRLLQFLWPHRWKMAGVWALVLSITAVGLLPPRIIGWFIDEVLQAGRPELVAWGALAIVGVYLVKAALTFGEFYLSQYLSQLVIYDLRQRLYEHIQYLSVNYFQQTRTGQLMSRVTADVETLRRFLGFGLIMLSNNIFMFVAVMAMLLSIHVPLTLVSLAVSPFLIYGLLRFSREVVPVYQRVQEHMAEINEVLQENLTGIRVVQAFARERDQEALFSHYNDLYRERQVEAAKVTATYLPIFDFLAALAAALIIWYGGRQVILGSLSLGDLVAFHLYLAMLLMPLQFLSRLVNMASRATASGRRIFEVLDTEPEIADSPTALQLQEVQGRVTFTDVSFSYEAGRPVLRGINLDVCPGEQVAILGATGSGKTTMLALIPRFFDPERGSVRLDGHDLRDITLASLRAHVAVVQQEIYLFNRTARENIAFGRPGASQEAIEAAARMANIHDFIASLPDGYDTTIGERGVMLSGGQQQRLTIARALLADAPVLILDESTSSVDTETEQLIQEALSRATRGRTSFIIAQRLSSVQYADRIVVLDDGVIVEEGTFAELLAAGEIFPRIHALQMQGSEELADGDDLRQGSGRGTAAAGGRPRPQAAGDGRDGS